MELNHKESFLALYSFLSQCSLCLVRILISEIKTKQNKKIQNHLKGPDKKSSSELKFLFYDLSVSAELQLVFAGIGVVLIS